MAVNIVTGRTGTEHITSDDFRAMNASVFGTGKYVFDYGQKFAATIVNPGRNVHEPGNADGSRANGLCGCSN